MIFTSPLKKDVFGSKLVEYGVPVPLIKEWSVDPQVNGKSIFDQLEDMDAAECLQKIVDLSLYNTAFVFIKVGRIPVFVTHSSHSIIFADTIFSPLRILRRSKSS